MNKFLAKLTPEISLRAGLGVMYLYSGIDIMRHPNAWFWAVRPLFKFFPSSLQASFTQPSFMTSFLRGQAVVELLFAVAMLSWFLPKKYVKWAAGISTLQMAGILFFVPVDAITFRDFGLLGGVMALFLILHGGFKAESGPAPKSQLPERKPGEGPIVQTFDQFIGNK